MQASQKVLAVAGNAKNNSNGTVQLFSFKELFFRKNN
jgi:hypothetical protein